MHKEIQNLFNEEEYCFLDENSVFLLSKSCAKGWCVCLAITADLNFCTEKCIEIDVKPINDVL